MDDAFDKVFVFRLQAVNEFVTVKDSRALLLLQVSICILLKVDEFEHISKVSAQQLVKELQIHFELGVHQIVSSSELLSDA